MVNPLTSAASQAAEIARRLAREYINRNDPAEKVRNDIQLGNAAAASTEGLNAVRQTPVPRVAGRNFADDFDSLPSKIARPVWGQEAEASSSPKAKVAINLFKDGFEAATRGPVNLSGYSQAFNTASATDASARAAKNGFAASLDDLPRLDRA
jgi:hypothetical protein